MMDQQISDDIEAHLQPLLPFDQTFQSMYHYAVFPAGKLFRPKLVYACALDDSGQVSRDQRLLASMLEVHHAYTLVHDDLPCMDDDDFRRGKASTHKQFGEGPAVLIGDGLLHASLTLLWQLEHPERHRLAKLFTWATGPKGLLLGQCYDLTAPARPDLLFIHQLHLLKTARLFQVALAGAIILRPEQSNYSRERSMLRLGQHLGLLFQLIDDLMDLSSEDLKPHEREVNPFITAPGPAADLLAKHFLAMEAILGKRPSAHLQKHIGSYLQKAGAELIQHWPAITSQVGEKNLKPVVPLLNRLQLT